MTSRSELLTRSLDKILFKNLLRPRLQKITVVKHGFFFPEGSSSQQAVETEEGRVESEEQVIELNQSEDEFGAFD